MEKAKVGRKGNVTLYIVFFLLALVIIIVGAFVAPFGILFTTELFSAGEDVLLMANESMANIDNAMIRESMQGALDSAYDNADNNVSVLSAMFKYSWVVVLALAGLILFLFSRRLVEVGGGMVG